jgi:hypothetical protein
MRPDVVVETGVAHSVTSRIALGALARNDQGASICRIRWKPAVQGHGRRRHRCVPQPLVISSRQRLPALTGKVGHVNLFIHDSLHTGMNVLFERSRWPP